MDSLKSLLDKKEYSLVIKLTDTSKNGNDLFYRISAFTCLGEYQKALEVIENNKEILEKTQLYSLINIHINLLCSLSKYDEAYKELEEYSNLPYESQLVEELLKQMPDIIANEQNKVRRASLDEDQIIELLNSESDEEILYGLDALKKLDISSYLNEIKTILVKPCKQSVRSYALMILLSKNINQNMQYLSYKGIITINPSKIAEPFKGEKFNYILRKLDSICKNVTLIENSASILSTFVIYTFPYEINEDLDEVAVATFLYSKKIIGEEDVTIESYCDANNLQIKKVKSLYDLIEKAMNDL